MWAKRDVEPHAWVSEDHKNGRIKDTRGKFQEGSEGETTFGVLPTDQEDALTKSHSPSCLHLFSGTVIYKIKDLRHIMINVHFS